MNFGSEVMRLMQVFLEDIEHYSERPPLQVGTIDEINLIKARMTAIKFPGDGRIKVWMAGDAAFADEWSHPKNFDLELSSSPGEFIRVRFHVDDAAVDVACALSSSGDIGNMAITDQLRCRECLGVPANAGLADVITRAVGQGIDPVSSPEVWNQNPLSDLAHGSYVWVVWQCAFGMAVGAALLHLGRKALVEPDYDWLETIRESWNLTLNMLHEDVE